jgi:hypothetical protein
MSANSETASYTSATALSDSERQPCPIAGGVGGQRAGPQRGCQPRDDMLAVHVAVQQQHLHQRPGAGGVAMGLAGGGPPSVMDWRELPGGAGLLQRGRPGQRPGLRTSASR